MIQKLGNLEKGAGKGKTAAIMSLIVNISFKKKFSGMVKNTIYVFYRDFLLNYVGYDKVYIIATNPNNKKDIDPIYDKDYIIFDIDKENVFDEYKIDDIFCNAHILMFWGGTLREYYFPISNRLMEWYKNHGDGHFYLCQDDPEFILLNPLPYIDHRLLNIPNEKGKMTSPLKFDDTDQSRLYLQRIKENGNYNVLNDCYNNSIIAYTGHDYPDFHNRIVSSRSKKLKKEIGNPKYWCELACYKWQAVNDNLDEKLVDYPYNRKYLSEYHGYKKHNDNRIDVTENFYNIFDEKILLITSTRFGFSDNMNADLHPVVRYDKLFELISSTSYSTFITANDTIFNNFISPRYFDTMLCDIIPFVYCEYDKKKDYTDDEELKEFMYVSTPEEFRDKVKKIANDESYYRHIKYLQRKSIYDKYGQYLTEESKQKFDKFFSECKYK